MAKKTYFFDEDVKEKMKLFDLKGKNIFHRDFDLIMDFSPYISQIVWGKTMKLHDFMLAYVAGGQSKIEFNMREFDLHKGSMFFLNKNSTIRTLEATTDYSPISLSFDAPELFVGTSLLKRDMVCIESLNEELQLAVMGIFSSIPKVVATDNPLLNPSVKGLITSLLGIVEDTVKDNNLTITGKNYNAAKILTDNFFYELNKQDSPVRNLQHYAEAVGKSVDYLTRVVKKETGFSPMHWINQRTIRLAQVMLCDKTQNFSINHIANFLNFATAEHFSKLFKTIAGMSPTEYRIGNI